MALIKRVTVAESDQPEKNSRLRVGMIKLRWQDDEGFRHHESLQSLSALIRRFDH